MDAFVLGILLCLWTFFAVLAYLSLRLGQKLTTGKWLCRDRTLCLTFAILGPIALAISLLLVVIVSMPWDAFFGNDEASW